MKRLILLTLALAAAFAPAKAQMRKLRLEEIAFYTTVHKALYAAMPHTYKDWTVVNDEKPEMDVANFWCQAPEGADPANCRGKTFISTGTTEPYGLVSRVEFAMSQTETGQLMVAAFKGITDYKDAAQIAKAMKGTANAKLAIQIVVNIDGGDFDLIYCGRTPPQNIKLPVPAAHALKGIRSPECPIMSEGAADMHANYYDEALIFLGKPVAGKTPDNWSDGLSGMRYKIGFDHAKIGKTVVQNVAITIKGDAADIDAAIALIDWQKLYALINK